MGKNIWIIGAVSFLTDSATSIVTSTLPLFVVYVLREDVEKLGVIVAVATFISYAFRVFFGYISDRYRVVKPLVVFGYSLSAISKPLFYFVSDWKGVAFLRGVDRLGKAVRSAPRDALLSMTRGETGSGRAFGIHKAFDVGGETAGALVAMGAFITLGSGEETFRLLYLMTLIPGALSLLLLFFVVDVPKSVNTQTPSLVRDKHLIPFLVYVFITVFFVWDNAFFLVRAKEMGWQDALVPGFIVALNLTQTLSSYPVGVLIDKFSPELVFRFSIFFGFLSMVFLKLGFMVVSCLFLGIHMVSLFNSVRSLISEKATNRATLYGVFYGGYAVAGSAGSLLTGFLWNRLGFDVAINVSIVGLFFLILLKSFK